MEIEIIPPESPRDEGELWFGHYICPMCNSCSAGAEGSEADIKRLTYEAATRRPPSLPLTHEALWKMPDLDWVWVCDGGEPKKLQAYIVRASIRLGVFMNEPVFVKKPSPADIEAARKGKP